jgi:hypothetical protein
MRGAEYAHPALIPLFLENVLCHDEVCQQDEQRGEGGEGYGFVEESVSGARQSRDLAVERGGTTHSAEMSCFSWKDVKRV